ncbi:sensor histidine kinase [Methylocucumis oryzae]|uniref:sensor histidine kinase n=1 Tax=Methylocucumis oryzae TaxID=1632867 RepID=UPI00069797E0|nr:ATP-binding protein [Methylocucumis oryzae]
MLLDKSVNHDEVLLRTLAGRNFYASIQTVVKQKSDGQLLLYGIIEDISERKHAEQVINELNETLMKRAQELESVNKELEAFSYSVSHDLRAPLRALDGFSRILLDEYQDRLDDKAKDRLSRIRKAAQTMSGLIDDLLQLSRITRVELTVKPVNLSQLATDIIVELQKEASEHQVSCIIQDNVTALGDAKLLRIVLVNLLGNAWKFTRNTDQAVIEFGVRSSETESTTIYYVRDNGAGFDMAYADKLFKAFQRLHSANEFPGTGIGLATVYRIILKHSGRIWAQSEIGQGACFYFTLGK